MTIRWWITGMLLAASTPARADDGVFWRVLSSSTAVVTSIDNGGALSWSNSAPGQDEQVQRATSLAPGNWQDYVKVPVTGTTASVMAFDPNPPPGMVLIPAGRFVMGASTNLGQEDYGDETPQHTVNVSAFYMDEREVTKTLWDDVANWASTNGYDISAGSAAGKAPDHPVQMVTWYECVKWCNARSRKEGLTPCYTNANGSVHTNGNFAGGCNWSASGYRLPTEAEWEKAARGGAADHRFPWSDAITIQHARANYYSDDSFGNDYDTSPTRGYHPTYNDGIWPYTSPAGSFAATGYGLYDMAGNAWEWCWDWYASAYYSTSPEADPKGPVSGSTRVIRGGGFDVPAFYSRVCCRNIAGYPYNEADVIGFRCARRR